MRFVVKVPKGARMNLSQAWKSQENRREWWVPKGRRAKDVNQMSACYMEDKVGDTALLGLWEEANWAKHVPRSQPTWSALVSYIQTSLGRYLVGSAFCSEARGREGMCFLAVKGEGYGSRSGQAIPCAQSTNSVAITHRTTVAGGKQRTKIIIAIATIYWVPTLVDRSSTKHFDVYYIYSS